MKARLRSIMNLTLLRLGHTPTASFIWKMKFEMNKNKMVEKAVLKLRENIVKENDKIRQFGE